MNRLAASGERTPRRQSLGAGLYRLLLVLYPSDFRRAFGGEMASAFEQDLERARPGGAAALARFWLDIARDVIGSASRQRARQVLRGLTGVPEPDVPQLPPGKTRSEMDTLLQDVRFAIRQFIHRPGFTAVAVLSLALAIGGNSLMYGLIDGFVLHPFPYPDSDRFVAVGVTFPKVSAQTNYIEVLSPAEYTDIKSAGAFASLAAFDLGNRNISGGDVPERVFTALLLDDLFPVIGMEPALGRGFTREELSWPGAPVAIISHRLWQTRFGGDPQILGRTIRVGGQAGSIVGVMPPGLLMIGTDLWLPWGGNPAEVARNVRQFTILGRVKPQASVEQANGELAAIAGRVAQTESARFKEYEGWRLTATPWAAALTKDMRPAAFMLLGAVAFVLLIACANLTNLFLARSTSRQRELAVRLALGAARSRLARQLLTESMLLAAAGAILGLAVAFFGLKSADVLIPSQFQTLGLEAGLNVRVLLWSLALALAAGVLVAILPALHATRTDPHDSLKADGRAGAARGGQRVRHMLVVAEIALSVALFLGAALLIRSFANIKRIDPGFDPRGVLTMRLTLPSNLYQSGEAITGFFEQLVERVQATPGIASAAVASQYPPQEAFTGQIEVEGMPSAGTTLPTARTTIVSRGLFNTLRVPVVAGRTFDERDRPNSPRVLVINQEFADRYLAGRQPIGSRVRIGRGGTDRPWWEVIGIVGNARNQGIAAEVQPEVFMSMERGRDAWNQLFLLVRSEKPTVALLGDVRRAVTSIDPQQPVYAIQTLDEALAASSFQQRTSALLLGIFAGVALVLAAIGIYGVLSYSVSARTQEIGVRIAIGAQRGAVVWLVLKQVLLLAVAGLVIGVSLVLLARRGLEGLLFGVRAADPVTIAIVAVFLTLVALAAAWAPAARASRVDPIQALRYE
jgi:putative ABC transport system permease protein